MISPISARFRQEFSPFSENEGHKNGLLRLIVRQTQPREGGFVTFDDVQGRYRYRAFRPAGLFQQFGYNKTLPVESTGRTMTHQTDRLAR